MNAKKQNKPLLARMSLSLELGHLGVMTTAAELSSDRLVDNLIRSRIAELEESSFAPQADLPFIVADSRKTLRQHQRWMQFLPQIQPFYGEVYQPSR